MHNGRVTQRGRKQPPPLAALEAQGDAKTPVFAVPLQQGNLAPNPNQEEKEREGGWTFVAFVQNSGKGTHGATKISPLICLLVVDCSCCCFDVFFFFFFFFVPLCLSFLSLFSTAAAQVPYAKKEHRAFYLDPEAAAFDSRLRRK